MLGKSACSFIYANHDGYAAIDADIECELTHAVRYVTHTFSKDVLGGRVIGPLFPGKLRSGS